MRLKLCVFFAVAVWVIAGPIAMTFGGCPTMASMCEAPCGISACTFAPPIGVSAPQPVAVVGSCLLPAVTSAFVAVLDPPPKPAHRSA